jgi:L-asparaginase
MTERHSERVVVFGLGGTIAMSTSERGGVIPTLSAEDLVAAVPGLAGSGIAIDVVDVRRLPGASVGFDDLVHLSAAVADAIAGGATGVVVTQGTDTIEETAYLLDLTHPHSAPLVVTGAMRNPTMAGADGPANLLAAVRTAADPSARGLGVLVVMNDEIHAAHRVRKTHATAVDTFQSVNGGPLGYVIEGRPRLVNRPPARLVVPTPRTSSDPRVFIHTVVLGDDAAIVEAIAQRVDGLVIAAMGVGHVPEHLVEPLAQAATRIPVVLTSRTGAGSVLRETYGFPGSERDLVGHGLIPAGLLNPLKARILLRCLLAGDTSRADVHRAFAVAGNYVDHTDWPWPAP